MERIILTENRDSSALIGTIDNSKYYPVLRFFLNCFVINFLKNKKRIIKNKFWKKFNGFLHHNSFLFATIGAIIFLCLGSQRHSLKPTFSTKYQIFWTSSKKKYFIVLTNNIFSILFIIIYCYLLLRIKSKQKTYA